MASLNKVQLIGNLGKDPEVKYSQGGVCIVNFSLATTNREKDGNSGGYKDVTEWHNIVMFGKVAEIAEKWLSKGASIYAEGRIKTEQWQDKEGVTRYTTKIIVDQMQMLSSKNQGTSNTPGSPPPGVQQTQQATQSNNAHYYAEKPAAAAQGQQKGFNWDENDNDLPF